MNYTTLYPEVKDQTGTIWFNRPDIHNAFNEVMVSEIIDAINELNHDRDVRVIVLRGKGKSFCAGADLNWMRDVKEYSYEQNYKESYRLSQCFDAIYRSAKPTIAIVHGASIGGANGLLSSCDMAFAEKDTVFSLSEVKIGLVPSCISPYVIKKVGESNARYLMLTGTRFKGDEAEKYGLVNASLPSGLLEDHLNEVIGKLMTSGPNATKQCKLLIDEVVNKKTLEELLGYTAELIAAMRSSDEGQEGISSFLEKRKPNWVK
jgi:methylglutaconyl-CoA hydratase